LPKNKKLKVLIINKFDNTGGAAIASKRLYEALRLQNIDVDFLVQESSLKTALSTTNNFLKRKINFLRFSLERLKILINIKDKKNLFFFDSASFGEDISKLKIVQEADIIHLNWICFGFLSLKSLKNILKLKKPIFWTLHDMWTLTGGCFHSRGCDKYMDNCKDCKYLKSNSRLATKVLNKKIKLFNSNNLFPVAISNWSKQNIEKSIVFKNKSYIIGNTINTNFFKPKDKILVKQKLNLNSQKFYIGFIAFNITNEYKGGKYLLETLKIIENNNLELYNNIELIAIGMVKDVSFFPNNLNIHFEGYVSDENKMLDYYNAMDIFVLPSLEENLPLVIQESMSCEIPAVAFDTGGISDMIEHNKNGYLAEYKNSNDLAYGIIKLLTDKDFYNMCSVEARKKIIETYSYEVISTKLIKHYKNVLS